MEQEQESDTHQLTEENALQLLGKRSHRITDPEELAR